MAGKARAARLVCVVVGCLLSLVCCPHASSLATTTTTTTISASTAASVLRLRAVSPSRWLLCQHCLLCRPRVDPGCHVHAAQLGSKRVCVCRGSHCGWCLALSAAAAFAAAAVVAVGRAALLGRRCVAGVEGLKHAGDDGFCCRSLCRGDGNAVFGADWGVVEGDGHVVEAGTRRNKRHAHSCG